MNLDDIEESWKTLRQQPREEISGRRASGVPIDRPVYLAIDYLGRRHLLVQVPEGSVPIDFRETKGLEVVLDSFAIGSNAIAQYIDLICTDAAHNRTFGVLAQDIITCISGANGTSRDIVAGSLSRWHSFWMTRPPVMSKESALGLFGEMWFLNRWLGNVDGTVIGWWQKLPSSRHDFQSTNISIEVKTSSTGRTSAPSHVISSIDQLADPEKGRLLLFSLHVVEDALSSNTLERIVGSIRRQLSMDDAGLAAFNNKLAIVGYDETDTANVSRCYRMIAEALYSVEEGFPRIVKSSFGGQDVPSGIGEIKYSIDMSACSQWLIASDPDDSKVHEMVSHMKDP